VAAAWSRWRNVTDLDSSAFTGAGNDDGKLPETTPSHRLAINHDLGRGWRAWVIPLAGGETSVGMVYDPRYIQLPAG